ncbi:MAG: hypothetical protein TQ35_0007345 [Candidatus Aramenus sulfurataquae]|jgi:predicted  nucleic acid-binding Zn-ribbon protein|uniref:Uncharacterized protein n=3 Tax=Candidatus Aramenus sulfurataquae TaxID=1326980 RepID=A0AAE3FKE1_9CREN|nr:hypothetical protein [Candidatus Aramenus sulfurataquae]
MAEDIVKALASNDEFAKKVANMLYEKIRNDIILNKFDDIYKILSELTNAVQRNTDHIVLLWEKMDQNDRTISSILQILKDNTESIREMQNEIKNLNVITQKHTEIIENLQKNIEAHTKAIEAMQRTIEKQGEVIEAHTKAIEAMQRTIEKQGEVIEAHTKAMDTHSKAIEGLQNAVLKLSTEIGAFTNRAGKGLERSIMNVYKEALKLHGVDPSNVKHGKIKDTMGVVDKDKEFEVDFYETDDYVYVFEVKNYADEGVLEQMRNRVKLFSAIYKKPVKFFIVSNYIEKDVKEEAEKEGAVVITSQVIEEEED